jgi:hypothetical protein
MSEERVKKLEDSIKLLWNEVSELIKRVRELEKEAKSP